MGSRHLVVFDMDGVLIDVSGSYRDTVRKAARQFLKGAAGWEALPDPLFSLAELAQLKQAGGLNNDWDLTCRALTLLFAKVRKGRLSRSRDPWTRFEESIRRCDVSELTGWLQAEQAPLSSLRVSAPIPEDPFVAAFFRGDVGSGNIIKQIFQEVYLGRRLFQKTYGFAPRRHRGRGLIEREKPIVRPADLQSLAERHILAIATGRPACEADYPLQAFGLASVFFHSDDTRRLHPGGAAARGAIRGEGVAEQTPPLHAGCGSRPPHRRLRALLLRGRHARRHAGGRQVRGRLRGGGFPGLGA